MWAARGTAPAIAFDGTWKLVLRIERIPRVAAIICEGRSRELQNPAKILTRERHGTPVRKVEMAFCDLETTGCAPDLTPPPSTGYDSPVD